MFGADGWVANAALLSPHSPLTLASLVVVTAVLLSARTPRSRGNTTPVDPGPLVVARQALLRRKAECLNNATLSRECLNKRFD